MEYKSEGLGDIQHIKFPLEEIVGRLGKLFPTPTINSLGIYCPKNDENIFSPDEVGDDKGKLAIVHRSRLPDAAIQPKDFPNSSTVIAYVWKDHSGSYLQWNERYREQKNHENAYAQLSELLSNLPEI